MRQLADTDAPGMYSVVKAIDGGNAAAITLAANPLERHTLDYIGGGFYATPTANTVVTVMDSTDNTEMFQGPVTASGLLIVPLDGLQAPLGHGVTITLGAGGQLKDLSIKYR